MFEKFSRAIAAFDAYHDKDPNTKMENGNVYPKELLYACRMSERLAKFAPEADEAVQLAARCQHIGRWEIPREKYPMDKKGYLQWRNEEKMRHARIGEQILTDAGYEQQTIDRVKGLLLKKELYTNDDTRLLEDVVCLVFIEFYLADFTVKHEDEKVIDILRKTAKKMSPSGIKAISEIPLPEKIKLLISRAVSGS